MGQVIELAQVRHARLEHAAQAAVLHPALRWTAGTGQARAHRRTTTGITWGGITAPLRVAMSGTPLCPACYG